VFLIKVLYCHPPNWQSFSFGDHCLIKKFPKYAIFSVAASNESRRAVIWSPCSVLGGIQDGAYHACREKSLIAICMSKAD
jgi:hypothetical protein